MDLETETTFIRDRLADIDAEKRLLLSKLGEQDEKVQESYEVPDEVAKDEGPSKKSRKKRSRKRAPSHSSSSSSNSSSSSSTSSMSAKKRKKKQKCAVSTPEGHRPPKDYAIPGKLASDVLMSAFVDEGLGGNRFGGVCLSTLESLLRKAGLPRTSKLENKEKKSLTSKKETEYSKVSIKHIEQHFSAAIGPAEEKGAHAEAAWLKAFTAYLAGLSSFLASTHANDYIYFAERVIRPAVVGLIKEIRGEIHLAHPPKAVVSHILQAIMQNCQHTGGVVNTLLPRRHAQQQTLTQTSPKSYYPKREYDRRDRR